MMRSNISDHKRIVTGILGLMLLLIMLFSAFYIVAEADHDCTGEDCPVCACLQQCENILHQIGGGAALQGKILMPVLFLLVSAPLFFFGFPRETPVSKKVRLNN